MSSSSEWQNTVCYGMYLLQNFPLLYSGENHIPDPIFPLASTSKTFRGRIFAHVQDLVLSLQVRPCGLNSLPALLPHLVSYALCSVFLPFLQLFVRP